MRRRVHAPFSRAFTLIEIMVVVAIMGLILAAGIPSLYGFFHKEGLRKTMSDILETCQSARAKAIMTGAPVILDIHARAGTMEIEGGGAKGGYGAWAQSAKIEGAKIEALMVGSHNIKSTDLSQRETVRVHFYPDGTCDEMVMVLSTDKNEMRGVSLECTTSLATMLTGQDVMRLMR